MIVISESYRVEVIEDKINKMCIIKIRGFNKEDKRITLYINAKLESRAEVI